MKVKTFVDTKFTRMENDINAFLSALPPGINFQIVFNSNIAGIFRRVVYTCVITYQPKPQKNG